MQANVPVVVATEGHPRAKQAGITVSAVPYSLAEQLRAQAAARQAEAAELDRQAKALDQQIAALAETALSYVAKADKAAELAAADLAAAEAAATTQCVDVRFDLDHEVERVELGDLVQLG